MQVDLEHLRTWIGKTEIATEVLHPGLIRQFNATFEREFGDQPGDVAPLLIHFCLAQPAVPMSGLGPDGHAARGSFLPPVPLPRRMWAGGGFAFHAPLHVGDEVTRRSTIKDVVLKQGRTGLLCFVTVEHEVLAGTRAVLTERQDLVYRDATAATATARDPAPRGPHNRVITPTPTYLFRYSAMTFNGHRIHYDAPYAREVEGYPGLIVHGPLQATVLAQFAEDLAGKPLTSFEFRSVGTIFDTGDFTLNARETERGLELWTAQSGGPVAMQASACWER